MQNPSRATLVGTHNITGLSPGLDTLKSNGGPPQTHALLERSYAINAGDPNFDITATPTDQRGAGYVRKKSVAIDIGAFESDLTVSGLLVRDRSFFASPNVAFSGQLTVSGGEAGGTRTYSIVSGALPDGLALNAATGLISGTPTSFANSTFTYKVTDNYGFESNTATVTIAVQEPFSLVVTVLGDTSTTTDNLTSLREAVAYANSGNAGANPNVTFGVTGVIELNTPSIPINRDLTITGPGASNLTLSGNGPGNGGSVGNFSDAASIFRINSGVVGISGLKLSDGTGDERLGGGIRMSGGTATLANLVFAGNYGQSGGGVYLSGGSMALEGCTFSGNNGPIQGGAIAMTGGVMTLTNSTLSGNNNFTQPAADGGAIYLGGGTLSLNRTSISGNKGRLGGGIHQIGGTLNIANSTISGNIANAIYIDSKTGFIYGWGGGIFNAGGGSVSIINSTVSGNQAQGAENIASTGGGGFWNRGTMTVANSTVTANSSRLRGGGIHNTGALILTNSIASGNIADKDSNDILGDLSSSSSFNFIGGSALLGPLGNNGGPTQTHRLLPGSPVADAGDPNFSAANLPFDQRGAGFPRVNNGRIDIGAYESSVNESERSQSGNNLVVNSLADTDDGNCGLTDCTLREAVSAVPAGGTITFSVAGTITLTGGEILIDKNLSISGPANSQGTAPGITISGGGASRVFFVNEPTDNSVRTVKFSDLTLSGGNGSSSVSALNGFGGAILLNSSTTGSIVASVTNCTFSGNSAPGNSNTSGIGMGPGNGGAIRAGISTLTVTGSTFSGNTASNSGGAIQSGGTVTITNSTFSGNRATGAGLANGQGGAIRNNGGALTIASSTFSGNSATTSGGGITVGTGASTLSLSNTLVAGNSAPSGPDVSGVVASGDYNLVQNASGATLSGTHNITGQDPKLGALTNNGGPTQTMALLSGSPAIDKGSNALVPNGVTNGVTNDQRVPVFARIYGPAVDIGAFEVQPSPVAANVTLNGTQNVAFSGLLSASDVEGRPLTYSIVSGTLPIGLTLNTATGAITGTPTVGGISSLTFKASNGRADSNTATATFNIVEGGSLVVTTLIDNSTNLDGFNSLREAINFANRTGNTAAQTITFSVTGTIRLNSTLPTILIADTSGALSITGPSGGIVISGDANGNSANDPGDVSLFNVDSNANLSLTDLTLSGGRTSGDGGAINNSGTLSITNSTLSGNTASTDSQANFGNQGGAIRNSGTLNITGSTLSGNTAKPTMAGSGDGGAISSSGTLNITSSTLSGNITSSTLSGNTATATNYGFGDGGAISSSGTLNITSSTLSGNTAAFSGGAISSKGSGAMIITNSTLSGNTVNGPSTDIQGGGALFSSASSFGSVLRNSTFTGNTSTTRGGAIY